MPASTLCLSSLLILSLAATSTVAPASTCTTFATRSRSSWWSSSSWSSSSSSFSPSTSLGSDRVRHSSHRVAPSTLLTLRPALGIVDDGDEHGRQRRPFGSIKIRDTTATAAAAAPLFSTATSSTSSTVASTLDEKENMSSTTKRYDSVVVGGGPAGLLSAIMLSRKYGPTHRIAVYERRPDPPPSPDDGMAWSDASRFYLLGLGHRGQDALRRFGVYDDFVKSSVPVQGRRDWKPGMTREEDGIETPSRKEVESRVLARDKLVGVLHHHIMREYEGSNIDLMYGYHVEPVSFGDEEGLDEGRGEVRFRVSRCQDVNIAESSGSANNVSGTDSASSSSSSSLSSSSSTYLSSSESEQLCDVEGEIVTTTLLIGADGSARTVANAMEQHDLNRRAGKNTLRRLLPSNRSRFRVTRYLDDNPRVYKSVPIRIPNHWNPRLNYSARSRDNRITLEALPSDDEGNLCALLLMRPSDELAKSDCDPESLRYFFNEEFPCFSDLISDDVMAEVARKGSSNLPSFRYVGPKLYCGSGAVLLGDCAHTVKPYYGLGANTALEDVCVLSDALDDAAAAAATSGEERSSADGTDGEESDNYSTVVSSGVRLFSERRAKDAEALVKISRWMDRPGKINMALFFITPLILDSIFHKYMPSLFGPNMFEMFRKRNMGFRQIQIKKRLDRAMQVMVLSTFVAALTFVTKVVVDGIARLVGKSSGLVGGILMAWTVMVGTLVRGWNDKMKRTKVAAS